MLNETGFPVVTWGFFNAYPVKWEISPMDSMENRILTETLEFSYNYFVRTTLDSPLSVGATVAQLGLRMF